MHKTYCPVDSVTVDQPVFEMNQLSQWWKILASKHFCDTNLAIFDENTLLITDNIPANVDNNISGAL